MNKSKDQAVSEYLETLPDTKFAEFGESYQRKQSEFEEMPEHISSDFESWAAYGKWLLPWFNYADQTGIFWRHIPPSRTLSGNHGHFALLPNGEITYNELKNN